MGIMIIAGFIGFILWVLYSLDENRWTIRSLGCILAVCFVIGGIVGISSYSSSLRFEATEEILRHELVCLRGENELQGRFYFLGSGYIGEVHVYSYYKEDVLGLRRYTVKDQGYVFINEEDRSDGMLVGYRSRLSSPVIRFFYSWFVYEPTIYHFYVPHGTVRRGFSI